VSGSRATATASLAPVPPFDFELSLRFAEGFGPASGEHVVDGGRLWKAFRVEGTTVATRTESNGGVDRPGLTVTIEAAGELDDATVEAATRRVADYLSVADDLGPFLEIAAGDPPMAARAGELHGLHHVRFPSPYEAACWAVLSQRTPIPIARRTKDAFTERFGDSTTMDVHRLPAFPEPADVAAAGEAAVEEVVHNARRARYVHAVTRAFLDVDTAFLREAPVAEVTEWLRAIDGIGEWSAAFVLFRGLGRIEDMPVTEPFLRAARPIYGSDATEDDIRAAAARYGRWAGYWGLYLRAPI
jgi:DNA-3-methyladenine glycosylase II